MSGVLGPIPAYNNPAPQPQFYQPSQFVISGVTLGMTTIVTTLLDMNYVIGQQVRLLIPETYGCVQLNSQSGYVISIPAANQVEVSINSSQNVNAFSNGILTTKPQILAIGDINSGIISSTGPIMPNTNITGSFINISPL